MHNLNQSTNSNEKELPYLVPTPEWSPEPVESDSQSVGNFSDNYYSDGYPVIQNSMIYFDYSNDHTFIPASHQSDATNIVAEMPLLNAPNNEAEEAKMRRTESNRKSKAREREHYKLVVESYISNDKLYEEIKHEYPGCKDHKKLLDKFIERYKQFPIKPRRVSGEITKKSSVKNTSLNSGRQQPNTRYRIPINEPPQRFVEHLLYHRNQTHEHPNVIPHCAMFESKPDGSLGEAIDMKEFKYKQKLKLYEEELPELVSDEEIEQWHEYNDQLIKQLLEKFEIDNDEYYFLDHLFCYFAPFDKKCFLKKQHNNWWN